jgi:hypothetical protein
MKRNAGLLTMVFSTLGIVIWVNIFSALMPYMDDILAISGVEDLSFLLLILSYAPTLLLLGSVALATFAYLKGYASMAASDANGLIRMVFGGLSLIMWIAMFSNIVTVFVALYGSYGTSTDYPLLGLAVSITPAIIFIEGLAASIGTAVGGYRSRKGKKALAPK